MLSEGHYLQYEYVAVNELENKWDFEVESAQSRVSWLGTWKDELELD